MHHAYETKLYLDMYEKMLGFYKTFATPKWIELPSDGIELYTLPLVIGKHNEKRTYEMPAIWERVDVQSDRYDHAQKLVVHLQLESKIKVMEIWTNRCAKGHHGCCGQHKIRSSNQHTIDNKQ